MSGISTNDKRLLFILLGLAVFLASYFGISKVYSAKQAVVETEISALAPQLETLRAYSQAQEKYKAEIEAMGANIATQLAAYPGDMRSEDLIMFVNELESKVGIKVNGFSIVSPELVSALSLPAQADSGQSAYEATAFKTGITASCSMDYAQMKNLVTYIYAAQDRTNVDNIALSYSSTSGALSASLTLSRYFIVSSDYVYDETKLPAINRGTENLFGTVTAGATAPTDQPPE